MPRHEAFSGLRNDRDWLLETSTVFNTIEALPFGERFSNQVYPHTPEALFKQSELSADEQLFVDRQLVTLGLLVEHGLSWPVCRQTLWYQHPFSRILPPQPLIEPTATGHTLYAVNYQGTLIQALDVTHVNTSETQRYVPTNLTPIANVQAVSYWAHGDNGITWESRIQGERRTDRLLLPTNPNCSERINSISQESFPGQPTHTTVDIRGHSSQAYWSEQVVCVDGAEGLQLVQRQMELTYNRVDTTRVGVLWKPGYLGLNHVTGDRVEGVIIFQTAEQIAKDLTSTPSDIIEQLGVLTARDYPGLLRYSITRLSDEAPFAIVYSQTSEPQEITGKMIDNRPVFELSTSDPNLIRWFVRNGDWLEEIHT